MFPKSFTAVLLAFACVAAAAGGAYVAVSQSAATGTAPRVAAEAPTTAVEATEAVVSPTALSAPVAIGSEQVAAQLRTEDPEAPAAAARGAGDKLERDERAGRDVNTADAVERKAPAVTGGPTPRATRSDGPAPPRSRAVGESQRIGTRNPAVGNPTAAGPATVPGRGVAAAESASAAGATATPSRPEMAALPDPATPDPSRTEPPPAPTRIFDELVIPSSSVIGLRIETPVSSERARLEDRIEARVLRDVPVDGRTALSAGARAVGAVTLVERGGKVKERARLGVRFHTLVLADGTELPMRTETILREGDSPSGESVRKIGGAAVGGAILGAILGGKKGAIVGGATGAAGGSAVVMAGDRNAATLPVGAVLTVRLAAPLTVEVERR